MAGAIDQTSAPAGTPPDLSKLPGCSPEDLAANASGVLSPAQLQMLRRGLARRALAHCAGLAVFGLWLVTSGFNVWAVIAFAFPLYHAGKLLSEAAATNNSEIRSCTGDARAVRVIDPDGPDDHYLQVAGLELVTTQEVFAAVRPGGPYRVYYLPAGSRLLGVRPEPGWRPVPPPAPKPQRRWSLTIGGE